MDVVWRRDDELMGLGFQINTFVAVFILTAWLHDLWLIMVNVSRVVNGPRVCLEKAIHITDDLASLNLEIEKTTFVLKGLRNLAWKFLGWSKDVKFR